ncbi:mitochondrial carrier domain-containing protein [Suillus fuscotomentosus]|uniref:Mitochondrial carrier domain-containing protein n=1 Tax=Suillus fuscotomentosus TaxID=1912939 RepID=A0AAD4HQE0_9AGAM|nr:mitochondrial carrier domain-containing protein [Suillus fuscotomentosus]KAG1905158.1 mitochondrial carrier domain-containing protein [Suillus fuscotomentosus]
MSSTVSHQRDKRSFDYAIRSGIAGGLAGCIAKTAVAPLDRVKILFQASNPDFQKYAGTWTGAYRAGLAIYRDGGARGLLQGHSATLLRIFPYAAIKFMAYDQWRALVIPDRDKETNFRRFTAGALAGMTSVTFTYPLELVRVRMAFHSRLSSSSDQTRPSFLRAMRVIYNEGSTSSPATRTTAAQIFESFPVSKFYRGFSVTMVGMIPYAGTAFLTWDFLRAHFFPVIDDHSKRPHPLANLAIGAVSGAISQTVSYPFEVVRRRMQVGGLTRPDRWLRWGETVRAVYASGGWRGFYVGLGIGYLKIIPMTAISFAVWQGGKSLLGV